MARAVGIDLGTTNSVVAVFEGSDADVVLSAEGARTTPSVVAFTRGGDVLVGEIAKRQAVTNAQRTVRSVKRHMGTSWSIDIDGQTFAAQEVAARVLAKVKTDAEAFLGEPVTSAVITVPAYFNDAQRTATKEAGRIAGLDVLRIINEPTAAALAYAATSGASDETVLVFDLGGGTFDVSLLDVGDGLLEVRATAGDNRLGGDDWDARLADWLAAGFANEFGADVSADPAAVQRLREAAEKAKIELSSSTSAQVGLPYLSVTADGPAHLDVEVTRARFEQLTSDLLERCRVPLARVLEDADVPASGVDRVVLVGGSTRMPAVVDLVRKLLPDAVLARSVNPDEIVAMGAARQAALLSGASQAASILVDVTPLSLGVGTRGGVMTRLIPRNTTIPARASEVFTTARDNQSTVKVQVFQGERAMASANRMLGVFELTGIAPAPRGVPQIEVVFDIDVDGIVEVSARDLGTGASQSMTVSGGSSLPDDEVQRMVAAAAEHAAADAQRRAAAEARNAAESALHAAAGMLDAGGLDDPEAVRRAMGLLSEALAGGGNVPEATAALAAAAGTGLVVERGQVDGG